MLALLPLVLTACGASLRTHAQILAASGELVDAAGGEIQREQRADKAVIVAEATELCRSDRVRCPEAQAMSDRKIDTLRTSFAKLESAYARAQAAHDQYLRALRRAVERGDRTLEQGAARSILDAWVAVAAAADGVGVPVPAPPAALVQLAGGGP